MVPPLAIDPQHSGKVKEVTLKIYRKAASQLCTWLIKHDLSPATSEEWDDLIVEWKHLASPSKTEFCNALAAVEFFFVSYRGKLSWAHQVKAGWEIQHVPQHTIPMLSSVAKLYAIHFSCRSSPRLGVGLLFQQCKGLRPSEMLGVIANDVSDSHELNAVGGPILVVALGVRSNTKAKRPQSVCLRRSEHRELYDVLNIFLKHTDAEDRLFPFTLEQYNRMLKLVTEKLGHKINYTPHSGRAGYASEARIAGKPYQETKEEGRWLSDASFRTYIDVVGAAAISQTLALKGLQPTIATAVQRWPLYFAEPWLTATDHAAGLAKASRRRATGTTGA